MGGNAGGGDEEAGRADLGSGGEKEAGERKPFHVGVLLDNGPHFSVALGAAGLCGAVIAGINPTRRGSELVRDITHTECQMIITETRYLELLEPVVESVKGIRIFDADSQGLGASLAALSQQARPRCGDRSDRALSAAVHLWHHRPAQSSHLLSAAHRPHRRHHRRDSRSHIRRCLLSVHADVFTPTP